MTKSTETRQFNPAEQAILDYATEGERTRDAIIAHLRGKDHSPDVDQTLDQLMWEGWLVLAKPADRAKPAEWRRRNMDPQPSYHWTWVEEDDSGGWAIVGLHERDRLLTGVIDGAESLIKALMRLRDTLTTIADRREPGGSLRIRFTLGDEQAIVALFEQRFGTFDLSQHG